MLIAPLCTITVVDGHGVQISSTDPATIGEFPSTEEYSQSNHGKTWVKCEGLPNSTTTCSDNTTTIVAPNGTFLAGVFGSETWSQNLMKNVEAYELISILVLMVCGERPFHFITDFMKMGGYSWGAWQLFLPDSEQDPLKYCARPGKNRLQLLCWCRCNTDIDILSGGDYATQCSDNAEYMGCKYPPPDDVISV